MSGALAGLRVLDLSRVLAGPWTSQLLGDFGADVVKIERPGTGDETRAWGPPWLPGEQRASAYFLACNRNKRSLAIDLANAAGQDLVRALADVADVLIENFRAGALERYGLDADRLRRRRPALIYCTISAYARDSVNRHEPGYDAMIQGAAGLMSVTGAPDTDGGSPQKVGVAVADLQTGLYASAAILAALHHRDRTGQGQHIEVPLFDTQVAGLANQALNFLVGGRTPGRLGTAHPNIVPYQAFATADGHLMLAVGNDRQFRDCVGALGLAAELGGEALLTNAGRVEHRDEVVTILAQRFATRPTAEWLRTLAEVGVPSGPINDIEDVFSSAYAAEQHLVRYLSHPDAASLPTVANPVRFTATPVVYDRAPPALGADSDAVLADWLGYSPGQIQALRESGAL